MSTPAAALWGKIINQIPNAKKGSYPKMPSNVIQKSGDYFTKGTETGLSSWSSKAQEKKERQEAYRKWLKARQNHKKKVIDVPGHYEKIHHPAVTHEEDDHDKPIYGTKEVDDTDNPILDEEGNVIGYKQKTVTDYDNIIGYKKKTVVDKEAWDEKGKWVDDVWHYEYEKGWRDGDFRWKGKSYNGG
jgi:hypothetical protein